MNTEPATRESVVAELLQVEQPEQPQPEAEAAPEPEALQVEDIEDADQPSEEGDGAETPADAEAEEEPEPEVPAVEPPHYWSKERKALFAALPVELQQTLKEEWANGERTTNARLEEAAKARKEAQSKTEALTALTGRVTQAAAQAEAAFASRWDQITPEAWLKLSREKPAEYIQLKAQHDAEKQIVQQANAARDEADQVERQRWREDEEERLKTYAPELADPEKGTERRKEVADYLMAKGATEQDLEGISASVVALAWKAMQFDRLQTLKPTLQAQPRAPVRPAAATALPSKERELQRLRNRFAQTGRREDAVALMLAEEG